jgi:predicted secreted protein
LLRRRCGRGDYADRTILGFSPDGGIFAFEEFGVGDGSGYPYATI